MKATGKADDGALLILLAEIGEACRYKAKRLKFMTAATMMREVRALKKNFDGLWKKTEGGYLYGERRISDRGIEVLTGIFGYHAEITFIIEANRSILTMDKKAFLDFLGTAVASETAKRHLYGLFYAAGSVSMEQLARLENRYLERYIPIFRLFDETGLRDLKVTGEQLESIRHIVDNYDHITDILSDDIRLHRAFSRDFWRLYREPVELSIIGYGEISTVMQLSSRGKGTSPWIWKKMPPFPTLGHVLEYARAYEEYRRILVDDVGLKIPNQKVSYFDHGGYYSLYAGQEKLDASGLCSSLIRSFGSDDAIMLFRRILKELGRVYDFNRRGGPVQIGIDGQLSNWVAGTEAESISYIDTSSPLFRVNGREQLDTELFIKNAPSFLRGIIRALFLKDVVDRYYDMRSVIIDVIANLYKEQRPDLIDSFISSANGTAGKDMTGDSPISRKEIDSYYSQDAFIWRFFQFSRKVDKFIVENILRKKYNYRLPGKVER